MFEGAGKRLSGPAARTFTLSQKTSEEALHDSAVAADAFCVE
jgi:hypothetical protein